MLDIKQLGGYYPVWGYSAQPLITKVPNRFSPEDLVNGEIFKRMHDEMSLRDEDALSQFFCLEIEVDSSEVFVGNTHSCCDMAVVTKCIPKKNLCAVYVLSYPGHYYYPRVDILQINREDVCFKETFTCHKVARRK